MGANDTLKIEFTNTNDWYTLPSDVKEDVRIFMNAFLKFPAIFQDAPDVIKNNDEVVKKVLNVNGYFIEHCPKKYRSDIEFAKIVASSTPLAVYKFDPVIFDDHGFVKMLAKTCPKVLVIQKNKIPNHYYEDIEIMDHLMYKLPEAFCIAGEKYRSNLYNIEFALNANPSNYRGIPLQIQLEHPEFALKAIEKYGTLWRYIPDELKHDRDFVDQAMDRNPEIIHYFQNDNEIQL